MEDLALRTITRSLKSLSSDLRMKDKRQEAQAWTLRVRPGPAKDKEPKYTSPGAAVPSLDPSTLASSALTATSAPDDERHKGKVRLEDSLALESEY